MGTYAVQSPATNPEPTVWSFDVTVSTNEALTRGVTAVQAHGSETTHHRVVIGGEASLEEAHLIAAQMSSCQGMCTGVYLRL
ncbi:hypothetical protein EH165_03190 [Nakamurella antarctica]|uniref:Uncharacterized protein n=1 Tax=Nakamurella antarctica TaxID=1902245 RepID=A0A3G8ZIU5_9ACTN|nr:hypothetical protein [Nakamurella antarctica]AZI57312.1 hypothetical protein EH165_03190 [Nakamurella antarctica]